MFYNIRAAIKSLKRRPGLSFVIIAMLAFGVGATTALFSVFYQVLLQPLPVPEPETLVNLKAPGPKPGSQSCGLGGECDVVFSYPMFRDLEAKQSAFAGIAAFDGFLANLSYRGGTTSGFGLTVSGDYFSTLRLQPAIGRLIVRQDEPRLDESSVVVLSYDYWRTRFGRDPNVINQTLTVNGQPLTIIGVAPLGFSGTTIGFKPQVFVPLTLTWRLQANQAKNYDDRRAYWLFVFARLKPGVTAQQSVAAINSLYRGILKDVEMPLNSDTTGDAKQQFLNKQITFEDGARGASSIPQATGRPLTLLLGLTTLVLLIVCVNVANLLLVRGASRAGEMAVRASVGASRWQLVSQLLIESLVLAIVGSAAGLVIAALTLDFIFAMIPSQPTTNLATQLNSAAIAFAASLSLGTVLLFGVLPALQTTRTDLAAAMKGQAPQSVGGRGIARLRGILASTQVAFSMVLLVLAGLFGNSLLNVARVNLGVRLDSVVSFSVSPGANGYSSSRTIEVFDRIKQELAAQPGVTAVASASIPILTGDGSGNTLEVDGFDPGPRDNTYARRNEVTPKFFETLSTPLLAGRDFTDADTIGAPKVAIVNEQFVRNFRLGNHAIGTHFSGNPYDNVTKVELEIVGVVADSAADNVKDKVPPQYFQPTHQTERPDSQTFYVRTAIDPRNLMRAIPGLISRVDANLPVNRLVTMRRQVQENVYLDRLIAILSAAFAALATLLAAIGLYGTLAYNVSMRTREFGLRLALGAQPAELRMIVLRQVGWIAVTGGLVGLVAALALGRTAEALLFGLSGHDPKALAVSAAVLGLIMLAAGYFPARRASNVAAMDALRYE